MDAANKQWHLTSPTPYDPPLTYGGWRQSQTLGARIASILHLRESTIEPPTADSSSRTPALVDVGGDDEDKTGHPKPKLRQGRRRKHKIVIHTSPFLRCVQTSIAISAGIAEYRDPVKVGGHVSNAKAPPMHWSHPMHSGSPHIRAMEDANAPHLDAIPEPKEDSEEHPREVLGQAKQIEQSQLRVDAFLGEWLSPDYFESITPPPSSVMMVAGAKADLLRQGEHVGFYDRSVKDSANQGNFPEGWASGGTASVGTQKDISKGALASVFSLRQSLPRLDRANSHSSGSSESSQAVEKMLSNFDRIPDLRDAGRYVPPVPSYAISPLDPIPPGYVAHAKQYCVDIDYAWDSMRPPLEWGNGGEYGEEWSAMHKRFRRGLHNMILWYGSQDTSQRPGIINEDKAEDQTPLGGNDEGPDIVLVLVTHGAGCNALIGALTNQPVLLDVGMASLTMAVRKENGRKSSSITESSVRTSRRRSSIDLGISNDYEVKLTASTEHLRAGTHPKSSSLSQRSSGTASLQASAYRHHSGSTMSTTSTNSSSDGILSSEFEMRAANGIGTGGGLHRSASVAVRSSSGLWSKPVPLQMDGTGEEEVKGVVPAMRDSTLFRTNVTTRKPEHKILEQDHDTEIMSPTTFDAVPTVGQQGLWSAPPQFLPGERDKGPKRRWTHSEHR